MYDWNFKLSHAHTDAIRATLKLHGHTDAGRISSAVIKCTACNKGKLSGASHRRTKHMAAPGAVLCTDVVEPMDVTGEQGEKYIVTFTNVGSSY